MPEEKSANGAEGRCIGSVWADNEAVAEQSENARPLPLVIKRLWKASTALACFLAACVVANFFVPPAKQLSLQNAGYDFIAFYTAGSFVRQGRVGHLYKLDAVRDFQHEVAHKSKLELGESFGPFWNPPVFAWVFVPLSKLSYHAAWWVWFWINVACAVGAIAVLCWMLRDSGTGGIPATWWGLVPLLVATSMPFIMALGHGQNTCISLLLLAGVVWFWRKGQGLAAGLICGLLCYKPQLAAVVAVMLVLTMGWRAILGLAVTGAALLGTSALTLPGATVDWLTRLPGIVKYMQIDHRYLWERHVTLKAFWRLLVQGYGTGNASLLANILWIASAGALGVGLLIVLTRYLRNRQNLDRLIAATIITMPLLMPFYFDYDLLLLAVAGVLIARDRFGRADRGRADRMIFRIWIALFVWMFANPSLARWTHVNGTTILLTALAASVIVWASRRRPQESEVDERTAALVGA
jgi:hypothetical protein